MEISNRNIFIKYNSYFCDNKLLNDCESELRKKDIKIYRHDILGKRNEDDLNLESIELMKVSFEFMETLFHSDCCDGIKYCLVNLWSSIYKRKTKDAFFNFEIYNIPTATDTENISIKIIGSVDDLTKCKIIDKAFCVASKIHNNDFELLEKSIFYDSFGKRFFNIDLDSLEVSEIDIVDEIVKFDVFIK